MNWIKIDEDNIPDQEVLTTNLQKDYLVGYLSFGQHHLVKCESEETQLLYVTHYCLLEQPED